MDTTQRRPAGRVRRAGRAALSYWRYAAVGFFCLAFDWLFLSFWMAFGCFIDGPDCWIRPDTARDTVFGTGSLLLILGTVAIYLACRRGRRQRQPDPGEGSRSDSVHHAPAD